MARSASRRAGQGARGARWLSASGVALAIALCGAVILVSLPLSSGAALDAKADRSLQPADANATAPAAPEHHAGPHNGSHHGHHGGHHNASHHGHHRHHGHHGHHNASHHGHHRHHNASHHGHHHGHRNASHHRRHGGFPFPWHFPPHDISMDGHAVFEKEPCDCDYPPIVMNVKCPCARSKASRAALHHAHRAARKAETAARRANAVIGIASTVADARLMNMTHLDMRRAINITVRAAKRAEAAAEHAEVVAAKQLKLHQEITEARRKSEQLLKQKEKKLKEKKARKTAEHKREIKNFKKAQERRNKVYKGVQTRADKEEAYKNELLLQEEKDERNELKSFKTQTVKEAHNKRLEGGMRTVRKKEEKALRAKFKAERAKVLAAIAQQNQRADRRETLERRLEMTVREEGEKVLGLLPKNDETQGRLLMTQAQKRAQAAAFEVRVAMEKLNYVIRHDESINKKMVIARNRWRLIGQRLKKRADDPHLKQLLYKVKRALIDEIKRQRKLLSDQAAQRRVYMDSWNRDESKYKRDTSDAIKQDHARESTDKDVMKKKLDVWATQHTVAYRAKLRKWKQDFAVVKARWANSLQMTGKLDATTTKSAESEETVQMKNPDQQYPGQKAEIGETETAALLELETAVAERQDVDSSLDPSLTATPPTDTPPVETATATPPVQIDYTEGRQKLQKRIEDEASQKKHFEKVQQKEIKHRRQSDAKQKSVKQREASKKDQLRQQQEQLHKNAERVKLNTARFSWDKMARSFTRRIDALRTQMRRVMDAIQARVNHQDSAFQSEQAKKRRSEYAFRRRTDKMRRELRFRKSSLERAHKHWERSLASERNELKNKKKLYTLIKARAKDKAKQLRREMLDRNQKLLMSEQVKKDKSQVDKARQQMKKLEERRKFFTREMEQSRKAKAKRLHKKKLAILRAKRYFRKHGGYKLPLLNKVRPFRHGFRHPMYSPVGRSFIALSGVAYGTQLIGNIAALPKAARPKRRQVLDLHMHSQIPLRVDVIPDGRVRGMNTLNMERTASYLSFDGTIFPHRHAVVLGLETAQPWVPFNKSDFEKPGYVKEGGLCVLTGVVRLSDWNVNNWAVNVGRVPDECAPDQRLSFGVNSREESHRVDVFPDGSIRWSQGLRKVPWLSLSGIAYMTQTGLSRLPLFNGWRPMRAETSPWRVPSWHRFGHYCMLSGAAVIDTFAEHIATLPEDCRPAERLMFEINHHNDTWRIDLLPTGEIQFFSGRLSNFVFFDGIRFVKGKTATDKPFAFIQRFKGAVPLQGDYVKYGGVYEDPSYTVFGRFCALSGRISSPSTASTIAVLPSPCRPAHRTVFNALGSQGQALRLDVRPSGELEFAMQGVTTSYIALTGIIFPILDTPGVDLALGPEWVPYGQNFSEPRAYSNHELCVLSGVVRVKATVFSTLIGHVPAGCLPRDGDVIFATNHDDAAVNIAVRRNGEIRFAGGNRKHDWLSLSGISYFTTQIAQPVALGTTFRAPPQHVRPLSYQRISNLCVLSGSVARGQKTTIGYVSEECRPSRKLVFGLFSEGKGEALELSASGELTLNSTHNSSMLHLSGLTYPVDKLRLPDLPHLPGAHPLFGRITLEGEVHGRKDYLPPVFRRVGPVCVLGGSVDTRDIRSFYARLPRNCRPVNRHAFVSQTAGQKKLRIDVHPTGMVGYAGGAVSGTRYASLSGIMFPITDRHDPVVPLRLGFSWAPYGASYSRPGFVKFGDYCMLTGVIRTQSWDMRGWRNALLELPSECRPVDGHLIFSGSAGTHTFRIDVQHPRGVLRFMAGAKALPFISLDGIGFFTESSSQSLQLRHGWGPFSAGSNHYRRPSYRKQGHLCALSGVVRFNSRGGKAQEVLAQLPAECRPAGRQIFLVNQHTHQARVDVDQEGHVIWVHGKRRQGWLSLDGVRFSVHRKERRQKLLPFAPSVDVGTKVTLENGLRPYRHGFAAPQFTVSASFCMLSGVASGASQFNVYTRLPAACRPDHDAYFLTVQTQARPLAMTVRRNGAVLFQGGVASGSISEFDGIVFPRKRHTNKPVALSLGSAWQKVPHIHNVSYTLESDLCALSGVVVARDLETESPSSKIAELPIECRPRNGTLMFLVSDGSDGVVRIDVQSDGEVHYLSKLPASKTIALDGVVFTVRGNRHLKLSPYVAAYDKGYRRPAYRRQDNLCFLSGVVEVKGNFNENKLIGKVPATCRPATKHMFGVARGHRLAHVEVQEDGRILWVDGGHRHAGESHYISLDGIRYAVPKEEVPPFEAPSVDRAAKRLKLFKGVAPLGQGFAAPQYYRFGHLCMLHGVLQSPDLARSYARLPWQCRPGRRVAFGAVHSNLGVSRTDVLPDGTLKYVTGSTFGKELSLSSVLFAVRATPGKLLDPEPGWTGYGHGYQDPIYYVQNDVCVVSGLLKKGDGNMHNFTLPAKVLTLPPDCRPNDGLVSMFVNHQRYNHRVDVAADGTVTWQSGIDATDPFLALDGIAFYRGAGSALALKNGHESLAAGFRLPTFRVIDRVCWLSGTIKLAPELSEAAKLLLELPEGCKPKSNEMFLANHDAVAIRVDVTEDGQVFWREGVKSHTTLSLDGIHFPVKSPEKAVEPAV